MAFRLRASSSSSSSCGLYQRDGTMTDGDGCNASRRFFGLLFFFCSCAMVLGLCALPPNKCSILRNLRGFKLSGISLQHDDALPFVPMMTMAI
mmetsp:Transcript_40109/g.59481  ORF Transcript_40109/g.59481 Transcript_40109/m.59481 type:complete len:93 (+) Transcript_40109:1004-1282(+)